MSEQQPENGIELFVAVTPELDSAGQTLIKFAFFSENFALAVRMPPEHAKECVEGMRKQTYAVAREIELASRRESKPQLEVVKVVPDALRHSQKRI